MNEIFCFDLTPSHSASPASLADFISTAPLSFLSLLFLLSSILFPFRRSRPKQLRPLFSIPLPPCCFFYTHSTPPNSPFSRPTEFSSAHQPAPLCLVSHSQSSVEVFKRHHLVDPAKPPSEALTDSLSPHPTKQPRHSSVPPHLQSTFSEEEDRVLAAVRLSQLRRSCFHLQRSKSSSEASSFSQQLHSQEPLS